MQFCLPGLTNHDEFVLACLNTFRTSTTGFIPLDLLKKTIKSKSKCGNLKTDWVSLTLYNLCDRGFVVANCQDDWKIVLNKMGTALYKIKSPGGGNGRH